MHVRWNNIYTGRSARSCTNVRSPAGATARKRNVLKSPPAHFVYGVALKSERLNPLRTGQLHNTNTHTQTYACIYVCICVCMCISVHVFFVDANIISRLAGNGVISDIERNVCAVGCVCVCVSSWRRCPCLTIQWNIVSTDIMSELLNYSQCGCLRC